MLGRGQSGAEVLNLPASLFPTAVPRAQGFQGAGSPSLPLAARSCLPAAAAKGFYLSPAPPGSQTGSALAAGGGSRCQKTRQHHQEQMERTWHAPSSRLPALSQGCGGSGGREHRSGSQGFGVLCRRRCQPHGGCHVRRCGKEWHREGRGERGSDPAIPSPPPAGQGAACCRGQAASGHRECQTLPVLLCPGTCCGRDGDRVTHRRLPGPQPPSWPQRGIQVSRGPHSPPALVCGGYRHQFPREGCMGVPALYPHRAGDSGGTACPVLGFVSPPW